MKIEEAITEISRNLARELFPNTNKGRTISKMTADAFNTDIKTVHVVGIGIITGILLYNSKK